ncbi:MAG: hypothetical protein GWN68_01880, partial [Gemmatimonadetes bacterium]|nr:hypothetical protein [Gemmatimonadota bacterium]NIY43201.1 hypothetical protein [Gemmatimonadota bacterium]
MRAARIVAVLASSVAIAGCDDGLGVDLTGLWVSDSIVYVNAAGTQVDIQERDGGSVSLSVQRQADLSRMVSMSFNDGTGAPETMQ